MSNFQLRLVTDIHHWRLEARVPAGMSHANLQSIAVVLGLSNNDEKIH